MRSCAPKPCSTHAQDPSNYTAICGRVTGNRKLEVIGSRIGTDKRYDSIGVAPAGISRSGLNIDPGHLRLGVGRSPGVAADAGHLWVLNWFLTSGRS